MNENRTSEDSHDVRSTGPSGSDGRVLVVDNLVKHFPVLSGVLRRQIGEVHAVDGVSFVVDASETLALVGESGCGKTTLGRTVMRLVPPTSGTVQFRGQDVMKANGASLRQFRRRMQIVFQSPLSSLNPRLTAGRNVAEPMRIHHIPRSERDGRIASLFDDVGLRRDLMHRLPGDLSGGQLQRVGIARALALRPDVLILDEPVSSLDVSVQAQIVNLLGQLQSEHKLSFLFISHDLAVVRHVSNRVAVMYLGKIVETGTRDEIYSTPHHPYTVALLSAVPVADPARQGRRRRIILTGDLPSALKPPSGCRFRTRCWKAQQICAEVEPPLAPIPRDAGSHVVACHFPE